MNVWVVIPAYNEAQSIAEVVRACQAEGYPQVLVVDDGSTDTTAAQARDAGALVVSHLINRGAGAATQTGCDAARLRGADLVVTIDGDGQHLPRDIGRLVHQLTNLNSDIVIGSRFLNRDNEIPLSRRFFNLSANVVTFLLTGIHLSDTQCGMKAFNRRALEQIRITSNGYEFSSEIVRAAKHARLKLSEIPISVLYTPYSMAKGQHFATGLTTVFKLIIQTLMR